MLKIITKTQAVPYTVGRPNTIPNEKAFCVLEFVLYKKNVPISTRLVEPGSPGKNTIIQMECSPWGHVTRNSKYMNYSDRSPKCIVVLYCGTIV